ncbi:dCTP deaminase [Haloglomus litoreum]|uniref:dCTP deaminase n=1 Tax=Haloglomus litoreum TaxID=3034026 RepID=UPI0023E82328|nr:dCTP deaminase [Haloglomus sp. DT116]
MPLADHLSGIVHEATQAEGTGFDLTVDSIHAVTAPGAIDFGGGELEAAETTALDTVKNEPDDDYGWWTLSPGTYLVTYNESLDTDEPVVLQPRDELVERGASHPTLHVSELPRVPLSVPEAGLHLKENARVSTLVDDA